MRILRIIGVCNRKSFLLSGVSAEIANVILKEQVLLEKENPLLATIMGLPVLNLCGFQSEGLLHTMDPLRRSLQ
jgi:hypothetical protein